MAIWDDEIIRKYQNSAKLSSTADTHKCPSCAANIFFDAASQKLVCTTCGRTYSPEQFRLSDLLSEAAPSGDIQDDEYTRHEIICNSCGAAIIADKNTTASFCVFCGSPALIKNRLSGAYAPKWIVPFKINEAEATRIYKETLSKRKYIPKDFLSKSVIAKLTPMYVPFWLVDATCEFGFEIIQRVNDGGIVYQDQFNRRTNYKMRRVPFDGSKHINDLTMEQIQPYDYNDIVAYNPSYLQGYYAEKYNENFDALSTKILQRFRYYVAEAKKELTNQAGSAEIDYDSSCRDFSCEYALLPIWFLSYDYDGIRYQIAINGQTGKISGSIPEDTKAKKRAQNLHIFIRYFIYLAIYLAIWTGLGYLAGLPSQDFIDIIIGIDIVGILLLLLVLYFPLGLLSDDHTSLAKNLRSYVESKAYIETEAEVNYMAPASTYIVESEIQTK